MALAFRPHTATVSNPTVGGSNVKTTPDFGATVTVRGMLQPMEPKELLDRFGPDVQNAWKFFVNRSDVTSFGNRSKVVISGVTYSAVTSPEPWTHSLPTDHAVIYLEEVR